MKRNEWIIVVLAILGMFITVGAVVFYQTTRVVKEAEGPFVEELAEEDDLKGYEEPEETVAYLMAHIMDGDLEKALRSCAIDDLAKYFNMSLYLQYGEDFVWLDMIPPADSDDEAYCNISRLRLASDYGHKIQECIDQLSSGKELKIYDIAVDEPENPDGKYYERLSSIEEILGARDVCECIVYMSVDDIPLELHLSLARYKRFWKVILFSPMDQYKMDGLYIIEGDKVAEEAEIMNLSDYQKETLPLNYLLINSRSEEDIDQMIYNYCIYLQRGDILSALTYYDFGNGGEEPQFSLELLDRQEEAARELQLLYYQMLLWKTDFEWAGRHYEDAPEYIVDFLRIMNMQYVNFVNAGEIGRNEDEIIYQIRYSYDNGIFSRNLVFSHQDGWKILRLEY